ncbi:hypothetical protein ScPMuIL_006534 [Solemya velum]
MSLSLCRLSTNLLRNGPVAICTRSFSSQSVSAKFAKQKTVKDPLSSTERFHMITQLGGNEDPFEMNVKKRVKGTAEEPTLIPSIMDRRMVGCICEEAAVKIKWMMLSKGPAKKCDCGHFFKLQELTNYTSGKGLNNKHTPGKSHNYTSGGGLNNTHLVKATTTHPVKDSTIHTPGKSHNYTSGKGLNNTHLVKATTTHPVKASTIHTW